MDIWVAFTFWLLWIVLLCTLVYKYLLEFLLSVLLDICLGRNCWIIWWFYIVGGTAKVFSTVPAPFYIPTAMHEVLISLYVPVFLLIAILMVWKWCLMVVSICYLFSFIAHNNPVRWALSAPNLEIKELSHQTCSRWLRQWRGRTGWCAYVICNGSVYLKKFCR